MSDQKIQPSKIRTPIQLLAAWLVGLILVNGSFLAAAITLQQPNWASGILVIAAIVNVPLFLAALFLLQTRFRPEMQEDEFYSKYLERRYSAATNRTELVEVKPRTDIADDTIISYLKESLDLRATTFKHRHPGTKVEINDLFPRYTEILLALRRRKIGIDTTFGSTSTDPKMPGLFVVSVAASANFKLFQEIVELLQPFGLEAVGYADDWPIDHNQIYIGAYSYDDGRSPFVRLNEGNMPKILDRKLNWSTFKKLVDETGEKKKLA